MCLQTHSAGSGAAGIKAGASRPRTPGRASRRVCGRTALSGDAVGRDAGERRPSRPGRAARYICGRTALGAARRDAQRR